MAEDLGQAAAWHRQIMALVTAADRAGVAPAELPALRERLFAQQTRFAEIAARQGAPLPALAPSPVEVAAAATALGDMSEAVVARSMQTARATLDAADVALASSSSDRSAGSAPALLVPTFTPAGTANQPAPPAVPAAAGGSTQAGTTDDEDDEDDAPLFANMRPTPRNALIYGIYALVTLVAQVAVYVYITIIDPDASVVSASLICLFILPAFSWAAGWFTIGVVAPDKDGQHNNRNTRLGIFICLLPELLLIGYIGARIFGGILGGFFGG